MKKSSKLSARLKKAGAVFVAAALAASLCMGAHAADGGTYAPPDLTKTDCSITIHKYLMSPTAEWPTQENKTGEQQEVQATDLKPRANVPFHVFKVVPIDESKPITQDDGKLINDAVHLHLLPDENGNIDETVLAANNLKLDTRGQYHWSGVTNEQGLLDIANLRTGIYLVVERDMQEVPGDHDPAKDEPEMAIADPCDPYIVNLPLQYKDDQGTYHYNYNVHTYPKNGSLTIDKDIQHVGNDDQTANINEEETWIILPTVPHDIARGKKYEITDDLDDRLNYKDGQTVVVKPADKFGKPLEGKTLTAAGGSVANPDYTVTPPTANQSGGRLTVSFTEAGRKKLSTYGAKRVYISFITRINDSVIEGSLGENIPNNATIHYTNFYGTSEEPDVPEELRPEVHTGGVKLTKYKAGSKNVLKGAEFQVYRSSADALKGINPVEVTDQNLQRVTTVTSDDKGIVAFYGLRYGPQAELTEVPGEQQGLDAKDKSEDNSTVYYIKETKAPEGYNVLTEIFPVTIGGNGTQMIALPLKDVFDTPKFHLPITGGEGAAPYVGVGLLAVATGGAVLYGAKRKKKAKKE